MHWSEELVLIHILDLPELVRMRYANNVTAVDLHEKLEGDIDIPRLREGRLGGFFWYAHIHLPIL